MKTQPYGSAIAGDATIAMDFITSIAVLNIGPVSTG